MGKNQAHKSAQAGKYGGGGDDDYGGSEPQRANGGHSDWFEKQRFEIMMNIPERETWEVYKAKEKAVCRAPAHITWQQQHERDLAPAL